MNKIIKYLTILIVSLFASNVKAITYVNLSNLEYSSDNLNYSDIKEYDSLDDFLIDYNNNSLPSVYITNFLFDGVSSVKSPDLDDFIDNNYLINELKIRVININTVGDIELTGSTTGSMIGINTNNISNILFIALLFELSLLIISLLVLFLIKK